MFIFLFLWKLHKPTVFDTAFDREPGFKTENLIQYRIQCRHSGGASVCVCVIVRVRGSTTEAFATLFWATLNMLYYWKQFLILITRPMTRLWAKLITHFKQNCVLWMGGNKTISLKTTSSVLKMLFFIENIYKNRLITGSVTPSW